VISCSRRRLGLAALALLLVGLLLGPVSAPVEAGSPARSDTTKLSTRPERVVASAAVRAERRARPAVGAVTPRAALLASPAIAGRAPTCLCASVSLASTDSTRSRAPPR
jgi:hypothetical protein